MDEGLHQTITADASEASPAFQSVIDLAAKLSTELGEVSAQGLASGNAVAAGAAKAAESQSILGASIGKVEVATNAAARAFSALGVQTGTATARVTVFTEALDALGSAAPGLLVLGTALLGIGAAVGFVKEAIGGAAAMETDLNQLGVAVTNQGGNWDKTKGSVEAWAASLESATIFSRREGIEALKDLVTAGASVADSEKIMAAAADLAAGSGRSLVDVEHAFKSALVGRGMELERMDLNLKNIIKTHGTLHDVLVQVEHDYADQASKATDTFEGKQKVLKNTMDTLAVTIGTALLPELEEGSDVLIALADTLKDNAGSFSAWAKDAVGDVQSVINTVHNLWTAMVPENPFDSAQQQIKHAMDVTNLAGGAVDAVSGMLPQGYAPYGSQQGGAQAGPTIVSDIDAKVEANRAKRLANTKKYIEEQRALIKQALDNNVKMGMGGAGSGSTPELIAPDQSAKTNAVVEAQDVLTASLAHSTESEVDFKSAVALATTAQGKYTAEMALKKKITEDATQAERELQVQIDAQVSAIKVLTPEVDANSAAEEKARITYNNAAQTKGEDSKALTALKKIYDEAKKTYDDNSATLAKLTQQHEQNIKTMAEEKQKAVDLAAATAALRRAYNDATSASVQKNTQEQATYKMSLAAQITYYQNLADGIKLGTSDTLKLLAEYQGKVRDLQTQEHDQGIDQEINTRKLDDEENTYKKSISAQIAYYEKRLQLIQSSGVDTYNESKELNEKILGLEVDAYKERVDNAATALASIREKEKGLLDDILVKHKSARDELKTVYDDIKTAFVNMVEQMVLKSALLQSLPGVFGGMFGGTTDIGGKGKQKAALGGDIPGIDNPFASLVGGASSATGSKAPTGTESDPVYIMGTAKHLAATTGAATGLITQTDGSALPVSIAGASVAGGSSGGAPEDVTLPGGGAISSAPTATSIFQALGGAGIPTSTGIMGVGGNSLSSILTLGSSSGTSATSNDLTSGSIYNPGATASYTSGKSVTAGSVLTDAGEGATIGSLIGPAMDSGKSNDSSIGGALGGIAAAVTLANPLAGLGLMVGGSLLGSAFGSHTSASADPDIFNTQAYGQGVANLGVPGGVEGANGQTFTENYGLQQSLGGDTELQAISNYIKTTGGTGFSPTQMAEFQGVTSVDPASLHNGNLTTNTGEVVNYLKLIADATTALATVTAAGGVPSYTISNTLPNQGAVTAQGQVIYPDVTSGPGATTSANRTTGQGATVHVSFQGATIVGPGGMDTASVAISQSIQRAQTGQVAGSPSSGLSNIASMRNW